MHKLVILIAALLIVAPAVASANLLSDAGFEGAGQGPWGAWATSNGASDFDAVTEVHGGSQALKMSYNTSGAYVSVGANQEFSVTAGQNWYAEVYAKVTDALGYGGEVYLETIFLNSTDGETGKLQSDKLSSLVDWTKLTNSALVPADTVKAKYQLVTLNWGGLSDTGEVYFDDGVAAIPEPASMFLLGSGLVGLLVSVRKKK
jgi:hypothetical protein